MHVLTSVYACSSSFLFCTSQNTTKGLTIVMMEGANRGLVFLSLKIEEKFHRFDKGRCNDFVREVLERLLIDLLLWVILHIRTPREIVYNLW